MSTSTTSALLALAIPTQEEEFPQIAFPGTPLPGARSPSPYDELRRLAAAYACGGTVAIYLDLDRFDGAVSSALRAVVKWMRAVQALTIACNTVRLEHQDLDCILFADAPNLRALAIHANVWGSPPPGCVLLPSSPLEQLSAVPDLVSRWGYRDSKRLSPLWSSLKTYSSHLRFLSGRDVSIESLSDHLPSLRHAELDVRIINIAPGTDDVDVPVLATLILHQGNDVFRHGQRSRDDPQNQYNERVGRLLSRLPVPACGQTIVVHDGDPSTLARLWIRNHCPPQELAVCGIASGDRRQLVLRWPSTSRTVYWRGEESPRPLLASDAIRRTPSLALASVLRCKELEALADSRFRLGVKELAIHVIAEPLGPAEAYEDIISNESNARWPCPVLDTLTFTSRPIIGAVPTSRRTPSVNARNVVRLVNDAMNRAGKPLKKLIFHDIELYEKIDDVDRELRTLAKEVWFLYDEGWTRKHSFCL
ncbi:hypothetical protein AURDEDRAFT_167386 [Auricularia subglabra TFB-10046 SS5]|nr:hypothetical protein AURDEDRAFT_167386 [Auricularia subglabra TFB-10046 SS5]